VGERAFQCGSHRRLRGRHAVGGYVRRVARVLGGVHDHARVDLLEEAGFERRHALEQLERRRFHPLAVREERSDAHQRVGAGACDLTDELVHERTACRRADDEHPPARLNAAEAGVEQRLRVLTISGIWHGPELADRLLVGGAYAPVLGVRRSTYRA
jgi:hypothetical protein